MTIKPSYFQNILCVHLRHEASICVFLASTTEKTGERDSLGVVIFWRCTRKFHLLMFQDGKVIRYDDLAMKSELISTF